MTRQEITWQDKTGTRQEITWQDKTGQGKTRQDKTKLDKTRHNKARHEITSQHKPRQNKAKQDRTTDKTRQDKTRLSFRFSFFSINTINWMRLVSYSTLFLFSPPAHQYTSINDSHLYEVYLYFVCGILVYWLALNDIPHTKSCPNPNISD